MIAKFYDQIGLYQYGFANEIWREKDYNLAN